MGLISVFSTMFWAVLAVLCWRLAKRANDRVYWVVTAASALIGLLNAMLLFLGYVPGYFPLYFHPIEISGVVGNLALLLATTMRSRRLKSHGAIINPVVDSLNQLPDFLNNLPVLSAFITPDLRYGFANQTYCNALGKTAEDLIGRKLEQILPKENYPEIERHLKYAFEGSPVSWHVDFKKPMGESVSGAATYLPVRDNDKVVGVLALFLDRTKLDEAERHAKMHGAKLALAADVAGIGYLEWDEEFNLLEVSDQVAEFFAASPETLKNRWVERMATNPPNHQIKEALKLALQKGAVEMDFHFEEENGELHLRSSIRKIETTDGVRLVAALQDISNQEEAVAKLYESEQRFKDFTQSATDWTWEDDEEGKLTFISAGHDPNVDKYLQRFIGQSMKETGIFSEAGEFHKMREAIEARRPFRSLKITFKNLNGLTFQTDMSGRPFYDQAGNFKGYRGTCFDLTAILKAEKERKNAQETFATAFENISTVVALYDHDDKLLFCNKQFSDLFDQPESKAAIGLDYREIVGEYVKTSGLKGSKTEAKKWVELRKKRRENPAKFLRTQLADGRWVEVSDYPTANGGLLTVGSDISEKVKAEEAARTHEAALQVFNRRETLGQMTAAIAHELNQPLAAINNFAAGCVLRAKNGLLKEDELEPVLNNIADQSERASKILRSMSDYLWSGTSERNDLPVSEILNSVAFLVMPESNAAGIPLNVVDNSQDRCLKCAKIEIEQLLINLVKNAFEATACASVENAQVTLRAEIDHNDLLFIVTDNGPGFEGNIDSSAFEPFKSSKEKGLGVGLAICRTIANSHGGSIKITETGPSGTTLTVRLPLNEQEKNAP